MFVKILPTDLLRAVKLRDEAMQRAWTRETLKKHQQKQLQSLVRHAIDKSPFYRELYKNMLIDEGLVITDLPAIDKRIMMENYDKVVTDPRLKLKDLQQFIKNITYDDYYLNQYLVFTTSGSTGLQGVFVFNREEWVKAISTGLRVGYYAGFEKLRFPKRWRLAMIGAGNPLHVSASYYQAAKSILLKQINLPVTLSRDEIVMALNKFQPDFLSCYPSLASLLAIEQLEGKLNIHPLAVTTNAEVRTPEMQQNIEDAWGITPFNNYGLTEAGNTFAVDCSAHHGLHIFEDFFIVESVDENDNPVPDGEAGAKMLFTNLYNYSQPIIRYEIADVITLKEETCPCGHPFKLISDIEGRSDEIIYLHNKDGDEVPVHPHNLRSPIIAIPDIKQYQVIQEEDGFHITLALRKDAASADDVIRQLKDKLEQKLTSMGAICPGMYINIVDELERDQKKMGKLRLIKSNIRK